MPRNACGSAKKRLRTDRRRRSPAPAATAGSSSRLVGSTSRNAQNAEHRRDDQRLPRRDLAGRERALRGALDVRIEVAVGPVVERAAGRAHQQRAQREDRRPATTAAARTRRSTARTASATAAAACRSACRGGSAARRRRAAPSLRRAAPGVPGAGRGVRGRRAAARAASSDRAARLPRAASAGSGTRGARAVRASSGALDSRRDSLMNDSSIGAMRASASSQVTRGGRGRWKASATASNQPPIFSSASSLTLYARLGGAWNSAATAARARSSAWMWLVYTSSSGAAPACLPDAVERQPRSRRRCPARAGSTARRRAAAPSRAAGPRPRRAARARGVCARRGRVSSTRAPAQSP